jgi:serine/threonine protein kinase
MRWKDQLWDRVDEAVERWQQEGEAAGAGALERLLPPPSDPARGVVLATLIKLDQEQRWAAGQKRSLESYLEQWPELRDDRHQVAELLAAECRTRMAEGERPERGELEERFPASAELAWQAILTDANTEASVIELTSAISSLLGLADGGTRPSAPARLAELAADSRLGPFRIIRRLGSGGMGAVYLAEDEQLGREVAVKVLYPWIFPPTDLGDLLLAEARKTARLNHPSIVPIYQAGRAEDGTSFLAMEYVQGETLADHIARGPLPADQAAVWSLQLAAALQCAHQHGLVHRDVKPANVVIDKNGRARLMDFGLAVHERELGRRAGEDSGTLPYMAPEQIRGETHLLDGRADIWSLGVVLYEMLTGQRPFQADSREELREAILARQPRPLRQVHDQVPTALAAICLRCLAKSPADRYASAADLAEDLLRRQSAPRQRWLIRAAIGLAAVAASALALFQLAPRDGHGLGSVPPAVSPPPASALASDERPEGFVDVLIYSKDDPSRRNLSIHDPQARPLRSGDQIRLAVQLDRPAWIYLLWIDAAGRVDPVYPWQPGDWAERASAATPVDRIALPEDANLGWPIVGQDGMETVLLLVRAEALPDDVDLRALLADLPPQPMPDPRALVWFKNGELVTGAKPGERTRGPQWFDAQRIDDPVYQTQRQIYERLRGHFDLIVANSFAFEG